MANYSTTATVNLSVNGKQAAMVMDQMTKKAEALRKQIEKEKLSPNPDTKKLAKLQAELNQVNKILDQCRPSAQTLDEVLRNLDKASPRELRKTLQQLQKDLNKIERGSEAWEAQIEKIRQVKKELLELNEEMNPDESFFGKIKSFIDDKLEVFATMAAGFGAVIAAGKMAVDKFAEMDQEMANVMKYTGMTSEEVGSLNEAFKNMDTRSSREELNKLAQDAGRLGKTSEEEVLGFVKAADKINVALDDLGSEATLQLTKLAGIFGDEAKLGTERALLSVGSVINELSQNCSASAPYLAQFASRMGGVGAQAGLTVQQIMAMAAVLDSNSQALERSSTAVSQVMVRLYQDPAKYAKVAGLDVTKFTKLVKEDMNEAFLTFLETLNKAGGMQVLAPMFKDMGESGSGATAALSTLAENIGAVREQQEVANEAFREATSITTEFNVQNTTVQAGLDKAKKGFSEMAVELGEKLQPVMKYAISSSSALMRVLSLIVSFVAENTKLITVLTATIAAYSIAVNFATIKTKALVAAKTIAAVATNAYRSAVLLATAAVNLLRGDVIIAEIAFKKFSQTIKANPIGLLVSAIAAVVAGLLAMNSRMKEATKTVRDYAQSVSEATVQAEKMAEQSVEETQKIDKLFAVLRSGEKDTQRYKEAKEQIISQYGRYLKGLIDENGEISNLRFAYDRLTEAATRAARARGIANARQKIEDDYYEKSGQTIADFEKSLRMYGANEDQIVKLGDAFAKSLATGRPMPKDMRDLVTKISGSGQQLNENGSSAWWGKNALSRFTVYGAKKPLAFLQDARDLNAIRAQGEKTIGAMERANERFFGMSNEDLKTLADNLKAAKDSGKVARIDVPEELLDYVTDPKKNTDLIHRRGFDYSAHIVPAQVERAYEMIERELAYRGTLPNEAEEESKTPGTYTPKSKDKKSGKSDKVLAEIKKQLKLIKGEYEKVQAEIIETRGRGEISWEEMISRQREAEVKFYSDSLKVFEDKNRTEAEEYNALLLKQAEASAKFKEGEISRARQELEAEKRIKEQLVKIEHAADKDTLQNRIDLQNEILDLNVRHIDKLMKLYDKASKEYHDLEIKRQDLLLSDELAKQELYQKKFAELKKKYSKKAEQNPTETAVQEITLVNYLLEQGAISMTDAQDSIEKIKKEYAKYLFPESDFEKKKKELEDKLGEINKAFANGLIDEVQMKKATRKVNSELRKLFGDELNNSGEWTKISKDFVLSWIDMIEAIKNKADDIPTKIAEVIASTAAIISTGMQVSTQFVEAEMQIQESKIRKRYDKEIEFAEGNSYLIRKLEKQREKEIADLKNEGAKKQFAMQVIQTVAQTAQNAVSAYGAALQLGPIGLTLAPIAAAIAAAQGAVQIALLKKQQQAAESAGYSEGGFTADGPKNKPAGIVHAGEWVASQKLTKDRRTRPVIEALEFMQRTNSIGRLDSEAVSRSLSPITPQVIVVRSENGEKSAESGQLAVVIDRLTKRLDEPFVTVNTVTGDSGINKALADYNRLIKNASRR